MKHFFRLAGVLFFLGTTALSAATPSAALEYENLKKSAQPNWSQKRGGLAGLPDAKQPVILFFSPQSAELDLEVSRELVETKKGKSLSFSSEATLYSGTVALPFRITRMLENKAPDLIIINTLAEDRLNNENPKTVSRALEGAVRIIKSRSPNTGILIVYGADHALAEGYNSGRVHSLITAAESVARHYDIPSLDVSREAAERLKSGQITAEEIMSPFDTTSIRLTAAAIRRMLERSLAGKADSATHASDATDELPDKLDSACFDTPGILDLSKADNVWELKSRSNSSDEAALLFGSALPATGLHADKPLARFAFYLPGNLVGFWVMTGPAEGILEARLDGIHWKAFDLYRSDLKGSRPRLVVMMSGQEGGTHYLQVTNSYEKNPDSAGSGLTILGILKNGK